MKSIPFIDLDAQLARLRGRIDGAMTKVLDHGAFIMGPEVGEFETQLAAFAGVEHAITCANGTDALQLVLMAEGVGVGDAVFVPAFTFVASAEVVPLCGATPVFVDVDEDTFNISSDSLEDGIAKAREIGLTPRAVIPVDLFGQPADYPTINAIAEKYGLVVIADAAQGFGGVLNGTRVGGLAKWTTTSFFPAKPLGCFGDGGAILCNGASEAELIKSLRVHGKGGDKYDNVRIGVNSRLDTLQAAILIEKLTIFEDELKARDRIARAYSVALADIVEVPMLMSGAFSAWAQYTIKLDGRSAVQDRLKAVGVPTAVYYPIPMHRQSGYVDYPTASSLANAERLAKRVLSLPMHPYLDEDTQDVIVARVKDALAA